MNRRVAWVAVAVAFGFVVLLGALPWWFSRLLGLQPQKDFVAGLYGGLIGAFFTFILALVAWFQLGGISQTVRLDSQRAHDDSYRASADLLLRLKRDFFQEETRTLIAIIANEWIEFVEEYADGKQAENPVLCRQQIGY